MKPQIYNPGDLIVNPNIGPRVAEKPQPQAPQQLDKPIKNEVKPIKGN